MASSVARSSPKREMSAPETKALPPAPLTTTTRTLPSRAKASRIFAAASHMSSDTALRRSGLLKIRWPTPPSRRATTLSVSVMTSILLASCRAGARSHRIRLAERRDLARLEPELLEDCVGVLAEVGRRRRDPARRARQRHRLTGHAQRLALFLDALRHAEVHHLRIGIDLVDRIDRPAGNPGLVEALHPVGAGALHRMLVDLRVERVPVLRARGAGLVLLALHEVRRLQGRAEPLPDPPAGGGDIDMPVGGREDAGRNAGGMIVAGLLRHLAADEPARALEIQHEDLRLQERRADVLAFLRRFPLEQRHQNAERAEQSCREVGDWDADAHRPLPRQPGDRHQAAHALGDLVEARAIAIGAGLAETRDAGIDQLRVDPGEPWIVDAEPLLHVGAEILHHHVGLLHHALERREALGGLDVERHAALVAMQIVEVGPVARPAERLAARRIRRQLDLDDVRAPIGELAHTGGAGPDPG